MQCNTCNKSFGLFTWKYQCKSCNLYICDSCKSLLIDFSNLCIDAFNNSNNPTKTFWDSRCWSCRTCYNSFFKAICDKYVNAKNIQGGIELFPDTYKGKAGIPLGDAVQITTKYYRNKQSAELDLRVTAAFLGKTKVVRIVWTKDTGVEQGTSKNGTHNYTIWSASGMATQ